MFLLLRRIDETQKFGGLFFDSVVSAHMHTHRPFIVLDCVLN